MDQGNDISICIPLYIKQAPEIDQAFFVYFLLLIADNVFTVLLSI